MVIEQEEVKQEPFDPSYMRAKRTWTECWNGPVVAKQNWQRFALAQLAVNVLLGASAIYLANRPQQVPFVIGINEQNNASFVGLATPAKLTSETLDGVRVQQFRKFIESWRTVTTDRPASDTNWDRSFCFVGKGSAAEKALSDWFKENDPAVRAAAGSLVHVRYKTHSNEGANTYRFWWEETTTDLRGDNPSVVVYQARIVYTFRPPKTDFEKLENPMGITVTEFTWNKEQQ